MSGDLQFRQGEIAVQIDGSTVGSIKAWNDGEFGEFAFYCTQDDYPLGVSELEEISAILKRLNDESEKLTFVRKGAK